MPPRLHGTRLRKNPANRNSPNTDYYSVYYPLTALTLSAQGLIDEC